MQHLLEMMTAAVSCLISIALRPQIIAIVDWIHSWASVIASDQLRYQSFLTLEDVGLQASFGWALKQYCRISETVPTLQTSFS